jgi:hypothetical protein
MTGEIANQLVATMGYSCGILPPGRAETIMGFRELMRPDASQLEAAMMRAANDNDPPRLQTSLSFWWPALAFCALSGFVLIYWSV